MDTVRKLVIYNTEREGYMTVDNVGRVIATENPMDAKFFESTRDVANFFIDNRIKIESEFTVIYVEVEMKVKPNFLLNITPTVREEIIDITGDKGYDDSAPTLPLLDPKAARAVKQQNKKVKDRYDMEAQRMKQELKKRVNDGVEYNPNDVTTNPFL